jgi:pimeloyl-ACP methyl ester carboxylesterase
MMLPRGCHVRTTVTAVFIIAAGLGLAAAACQPSGGTITQPPSTSVSGSAVPASASAGASSEAAMASRTPSLTAGDKGITWHHTGLNHEVGVLRVPLDHDEPAGLQVTLGVGRQLAARPEERIGSLILLPGGPGGSGLDMLNAATNHGWLDRAILDRFDVVSFDPRGLGTSVPKLDCALTFEPATWDADDPTALDAWLAVLRKDVDACEAAAGPLLANVGSVDVARDVDALRVALGEDTVSILGSSYGTVVAQQYARLFPDRVRAMVLDSPVDLRPATGDLSTSVEAALQRDFDAFLADCAADRSCPFWSHGNPRAAYDALVARVAREPVGGLTRAMLTRAVTDGLKALDRTPLAAGLAAASSGDPAALLALSVFTSPRSNGYVIAVYALDFGTFGLADWRDARLALEAVAPDFPAVPNFGLAETIWPVSATNPVAGAAGTPGLPPILVVAATGDSTTPYPGAQALARALDGGVLVTLDGALHGSVTGVSPCVDEGVAAYLLEPLASHDDATCTVSDGDR